MSERGEEARIRVFVAKLDPPECMRCGEPATHVVRVEAWFGYRGAVSRYRACDLHVDAVERAMRKAAGRAGDKR